MRAALPQAKAPMTTQNRRTTAREASVTNPPLTQLAANLNGLRIRSARSRRGAKKERCLYHC